MSLINSPFNTLWIDHPDAYSRLDEIEKVHGTEVAGNLRGFIDNGFMILKAAVPREDIQRYLAALDNQLKSRNDVKISLGVDIKTNSELDIGTPLTKILDTHATLGEAIPLFFCEKLTSYLSLIFNATPLAFQSLHFNVGSTQAIHQDTAYVVVNQPLNLAASWIALEDVSEGSGELMYIPGSHRFPDYIYGKYFRHWSPPRDGDAIHNHHLHWLKEYASENGFKIEKFLPNQGDILIWHADLAHGGAPITRPGTRRSLVTHYCSANCTPHYFQFLEVERQKKVKCRDGYISSFYYDLI